MNKNDGTGVVHKNIRCDNCSECPIVGVRYKCLECVNYDLCEKCIDHSDHGDFKNYFKGGGIEKAPKSTVFNHMFIRIINNEKAESMPLLKNRQNWKNEGIGCYHCSKQDIIGWRYLCIECGINICEKCERQGKHNVNHPLIKMTPIKAPVCTLPGIIFS